MEPAKDGRDESNVALDQTFRQTLPGREEEGRNSGKVPDSGGLNPNNIARVRCGGKKITFGEKR